jgi:NAD-dependent dihydropyrimidine dehydrogenase PreA subunit
MEMTQVSRILYCHCAYGAILPPQVKQQVSQALSHAGLAYDAVPDLCELAARKAPLLAELAGAARLTIAACHPRAVKWLFAAGGAPLRDEGVEYLDMREGPAAQLLSSIGNLGPGGDAAGREDANSSAPSKEGCSGMPMWMPWFPVIDYERCQNCQQCLGFCLFSVYGVGPDGKVEAKNPANCKTDCPACARVCPEMAIIFPKYANAPINGGEVKEGERLAEPVKVDRAAMVSGDVLKVLQERSKSGPRFSPDPGQVKALQERLVHLTGSRRPLDVPLGALTSKLPAKKESE